MHRLLVSAASHVSGLCGTASLDEVWGHGAAAEPAREKSSCCSRRAMEMLGLQQEASPEPSF